MGGQCLLTLTMTRESEDVLETSMATRSEYINKKGNIAVKDNLHTMYISVKMYLSLWCHTFCTGTQVLGRHQPCQQHLILFPVAGALVTCCSGSACRKLQKRGMMHLAMRSFTVRNATSEVQTS